MMPGATPDIAGLAGARQSLRTCRALGLCQARTPRCLDCDWPAYVLPPQAPAPQPEAHGAEVIAITGGAWAARAPERAALDATSATSATESRAWAALDDPEADDGLGWAIAQGLLCLAILGLALVGAAGLLGFAWERLGALLP